jgi:hypothetical protein
MGIYIERLPVPVAVPEPAECKPTPLMIVDVPG